MLKIKRKVIEALLEHARRGAPLEVCGYLAEKEGFVIRNFELGNKEKSRTRFFMETKEQFEVVRKIRTDGCKLRGVYHSHPETPARLSERDTKMAYDPDLSYVIVSLLNEEVKSFNFRNRELEPERIEIVD